MKIAIMGAGGVGSCLGAYLARAGEDVTLIARGPHLAAMKRDGLVLEAPDGTNETVTVQATDAPADIGPVDVVFLTTKLYDLRAACEAVRSIMDKGGFAVPIQNGVTATLEAGEVLGAPNVVIGTTFLSSSVVAPGRVKQKSDRVPIIFGEQDGRPSDRLAALEEVGRNAGMAFAQSADIEMALWRKFVTLSGFSAVGCLARQPMGVIITDPNLRSLFADAMAETIRVGRAEGVELDDGLVDEFLEEAKGFVPQARGSMRDDLEAGRRLELDWLSGHVSKLGNRHGLETPIHDVVVKCLAMHADGQSRAA